MLYCEFLKETALNENEESYSIYDKIKDLYTYSNLSKGDCYAIACIMYELLQSKPTYDHIARCIDLIVKNGLYCESAQNSNLKEVEKEIIEKYSLYLRGIICGHNICYYHNSIQ